MASSRKSDSGPGRFAPAAAVAATATALLGLNSTWAAPARCANAEIVIDAKPGGDLDWRRNNAVLRDVTITQCDIRIQAEEAHITGDLDLDKSQWTFSGDVRIAADGGHLRSDKAVISFQDRLIARATITGSPAQFEQQRNDGSTSRGRAGTIDYQTASGTVSLSNDAWLTDGKNQISGQTLVYNIRSQSVQGRPKSGTPGTTGTDRIRIVIPARNPNEKEQEKKP